MPLVDVSLRVFIWDPGRWCWGRCHGHTLRTEMLRCITCCLRCTSIAIHIVLFDKFLLFTPNCPVLVVYPNFFQKLLDKLTTQDISHACWSSAASSSSFCKACFSFFSLGAGCATCPINKHKYTKQSEFVGYLGGAMCPMNRNNWKNPQYRQTLASTWIPLSCEISDDHHRYAGVSWGICALLIIDIAAL